MYKKFIFVIGVLMILDAVWCMFSKLYIVGILFFILGYKFIKYSKNSENPHNNTSKKIISNCEITPKDFTIIDLETTGLSVFQNEIIEIGAIKVRDLKIVDKYNTLCNPLKHIENSNIHGIKDFDVAEYKYPIEYMEDLTNFIGDDVIFAYNAPFDLPFLYSYLPKNLSNKIFDVLRFAQSIDNRKSHKLVNIRKDLKIVSEEHRAIGDCIATLEYYKFLLSKYKIEKISYTNIQQDLTLLRKNKVNKYANYIAENHKVDKTNIDENSYFYNKKVCFTGDFFEIPKHQACKKIMDMGGEIQKNINLKTNVLIVGSYKETTNKEKKAHEYNQKPNVKIQVISEKELIELLQ